MYFFIVKNSIRAPRASEYFSALCACMCTRLYRALSLDKSRYAFRARYSQLKTTIFFSGESTLRTSCRAFLQIFFAYLASRALIRRFSRTIFITEAFSRRAMCLASRIRNIDGKIIRDSGNKFDFTDDYNIFDICY